MRVVFFFHFSCFFFEGGESRLEMSFRTDMCARRTFIFIHLAPCIWPGAILTGINCWAASIYNNQPHGAIRTLLLRLLYLWVPMVSQVSFLASFPLFRLAIITVLGLSCCFVIWDTAAAAPTQDHKSPTTFGLPVRS